MKRAEVLQGLRQMKFEEILERAKRRRLSQAEAASILGMSERTFRRWRGRFEAEGADAAPATVRAATAMVAAIAFKGLMVDPPVQFKNSA